jgi:YVTN family beta-propeller protein
MAQTPDKKLIYLTVDRANPIAVVDVQTNKVAARITAGTLPGGPGDRDPGLISLSCWARLRCDCYPFGMIGRNNSRAVFTRIGSGELGTEKKDQ